ncbi:MAG: hypothetical protein CEN87_440 [Parcubacteria group bacterium Licking1014_1]|nr:MAG: hypothetical protein CEN87_440 [Parcubacteria group bacterium Licking1014_1]
MIEIIAIIIFIISFGGILFILVRKIPVLVELPQNSGSGFKKGKIILKTEESIKDFFNLFKKQIILHKLLSWVKCLTLKIETKIDNLLHKIRKKTQQIDNELKNKK